MSLINRVLLQFYFLGRRLKDSPPGRDFPCRNYNRNNLRRRCTDRYQADSRIYRVHNQSLNSDTRLRRWNNRFRYIRYLRSRTWTCSLRRCTCRRSCRVRCPQHPARSHRYWSRNTYRRNREDTRTSASILCNNNCRMIKLYEEIFESIKL